MDVRLTIMIVASVCVSQSQSKPIMVSFGTNTGPIIPPTPSTTTLNPLAPKNPAPVYEQVDDVPPPVYRPPTPNQYRNQINAYKPNPNLQLGTPLDIKYQDLNTLSKLQVQQQKADFARQQGLGYNGAQVFNVQPYEYDNARQRQQQQQQPQLSNAQRFVQQYLPKKQQEQKVVQQITQKDNQQVNIRQQRHQDSVQGSIHQQQQQQPHQQQLHTRIHYQPQQYHYQQQQQQQQQQQLQQQHLQQQQLQQQQFQKQQQSQQFNNFNENRVNQQEEKQQQQVPAIGIAYTSGLRYYVPQFYYYDSRQQQHQEQQQQQYNRPKYSEVPHNAIY